MGLYQVHVLGELAQRGLAPHAYQWGTYFSCSKETPPQRLRPTAGARSGLHRAATTTKPQQPGWQEGLGGGGEGRRGSESSAAERSITAQGPSPIPAQLLGFLSGELQPPEGKAKAKASQIFTPLGGRCESFRPHQTTPLTAVSRGRRIPAGSRCCSHHSP